MTVCRRCDPTVTIDDLHEKLDKGCEDNNGVEKELVCGRLMDHTLSIYSTPLAREPAIPNKNTQPERV